LFEFCIDLKCSAFPQAIIDFTEKSMGHKLRPGQKKFLRVAALAGWLFLAWKAIKASYKWIWKLIWSDKFHHILLAGVWAEAVSTMVLGHGIFGPALASLVWGKDTKYILDMTDNLGLTTPLENEKGQKVQLATCNKHLQAFNWGQLGAYSYRRPDGKRDLDYKSMIVKYPNNAEHLRSMQNSNNPDLYHNFVTRIWVNPQAQAQETPDENAVPRS